MILFKTKEKNDIEEKAEKKHWLESSQNKNRLYPYLSKVGGVWHTRIANEWYEKRDESYDFRLATKIIVYTVLVTDGTTKVLIETRSGALSRLHFNKLSRRWHDTG